MIDDIDEGLRSFLAGALADGTAIAFDAPTVEWSRSIERETLNLFLSGVSENRDGRAGDWVDLRDDRGNVVGRQPPVRRFDLAYQVSAWGGTTAQQHAVLGRLLATLPAYDCIPADHLPEGLRMQGLPVALRVGDARMPTDLWPSLGQAARTTVTLVVTAPMVPPAITELAPPAESLDLGLSAGDGRVPKPGAPTTAGSSEPDAEAPTGEERRWTAFRVREQIAPRDP